MSGALAIGSLSIVSSTKIDLTLAATPADGQALDLWYRLAGSDTAAITGSGIYDNAVDGDGLTTGRQLQLAAAAITAAAPVQGAAAPASPAYVVRNAPQETVLSTVTVPVSSNGSIGFFAQVYAPDGSTPPQVAFAVGSSSTVQPPYGQDNLGVNNRDF